MNNELIFKEAADYADKFSTCRKVHVGACFIDEKGNKYFSCNNGGSSNCNELGYCYKAHVTGIYESCEETRPYCQSVHAEVNMIKTLANKDLSDGILLVSRYPCYNCAQSVVKAGIKHVKYCGIQEISNEVKQLFKDNNIEVEWFPQYDYEFNKGEKK